MCFDFPHKFFRKHSSKKTLRGLIINAHRSACKIPVILVLFNETWMFSTDFRKTNKYQISWNPASRSLAVACGQTDRLTDRQAWRSQKSLFRNFANNPKMLFVPFWVIPRRLSSNCRRFGTHYRFHFIGRWKKYIYIIYLIHLSMKVEPTVSSETLAIITQTPGNYPKRNKLQVQKNRPLKLVHRKQSLPWLHAGHIKAV